MGDTFFYERMDDAWRLRSNTKVCRRSDNEPGSIWSGQGWVYFARRDASGSVCFDVR